MQVVNILNDLWCFWGWLFVFIEFCSSQRKLQVHFLKYSICRYVFFSPLLSDESQTERYDYCWADTHSNLPSLNPAWYWQPQQSCVWLKVDTHGINSTIPYYILQIRSPFSPHAGALSRVGKSILHRSRVRKSWVLKLHCGVARGMCAVEEKNIWFQLFQEIVEKLHFCIMPRWNIWCPDTADCASLA